MDKTHVIPPFTQNDATDIHDAVMKDVSDFCAGKGIKPETLALNALGNPRFFARQEKALNDRVKPLERLYAYMNENSR